MIPINIKTVSSEYNYDNVLTVVGENNIPELVEWHVYGNEQQGRFLTKYPEELTPTYYGTEVTDEIKINKFKRQLGKKAYELKDHLGNVRVTFSDIKLRNTNPAQPFLVDLLSKSEYYPYGMKINDLSYNASGARYGYNSQEQSTELNLDGNHTTAEFWEYDARSARRWNNDPRPVTAISPYATFQGNPILFSDMKGDSVQGDTKTNAQAFNNFRKAFGDVIPFQFNEENSTWQVDSNFDISKSGFNDTQIELLGMYKSLIEDTEWYLAKAVDPNETIFVSPYSVGNWWTVLWGLYETKTDTRYATLNNYKNTTALGLTVDLKSKHWGNGKPMSIGTFASVERKYSAIIYFTNENEDDIYNRYQTTRYIHPIIMDHEFDHAFRNRFFPGELNKLKNNNDNEKFEKRLRDNIYKNKEGKPLSGTPNKH